MIAVDTNLLVYAHRLDSAHHERSREALEGLVRSRRRWVVPWPCVHEFLAIVTHPRIYRPATPPREALGAVEDLRTLPGVLLLGETSEYPEVLTRLLSAAQVVGPKVHDARIAAICLAHGVDTLWTADRDFSYFPELSTHNPLAG
ncbi:type II toxin-antitoxin system VapC family toxin [Ruania alba]|uniref:Ribonuclease VapC n=1 Tax=Ruania alba TaxID=648782 RepID=A0A1H5MCR3_9MICO|nr:TA system VapC family ribonuclease toxin [Ruania alba]SEE87106.1 toxin-antitoxin system PIN domain toxin [Ruania alba]